MDNPLTPPPDSSDAKDKEPSSDDMPSKSPTGSKAIGAALLFHGMTGTPDEMQDIGDWFSGRGFKVFSPCLSGHASSIKELKAIPAEVWLNEAERWFETAREATDGPLVLAGQSFGALLSLYLTAASDERVAATILLSLPLKFRSRFQENALTALSLFPDTVLNHLGTVKKKVRENAVFSRPRNSYESHSIAAGARLVQIRQKTMPMLKSMRTPVLILQDPEDHHLSVDVLPLLRKLAPRARVRSRWIPGGLHELAMGPKSEIVTNEMEKFLRPLIANAAKTTKGGPDAA